MRTTIQFRITASLISNLLLVTLIILGIFYFNLRAFSQKNGEQFEANAYANAKNELRDLVSLGYTTLERYYNESKDVEKLKQDQAEKLKKVLDAVYNQVEAYYRENRDFLSREELEENLKELVRTARYDNGNYIWINDFQRPIPKMVMHPTVPALDGALLDNEKYNCATWYQVGSMGESKDTDGTMNLFAAMNEAIAQSLEANPDAPGEGYVTYLWPKPVIDAQGNQSLTDPLPKLSYVRLLPELGWVLGTGAWLADIEETMKFEAQQQIKKMRLTDGNYFWIHDDSTPIPSMVMHTTVPSLDGMLLDAEKYTCATRIQAGEQGETVNLDTPMNLFQAMNKVIFEAENANPTSPGEGYVTYLWPKPVVDENGNPVKDAEGNPVLTPNVPKVSYVKHFEEWGWVIGMGAYIDDIEIAVKAEREEFTRSILNIMAWAALVSILCAIGLGLMFVYFTTRDLNRPLQSLAEYSSAIASGELDSKVSGRFIAELGNLKASLEAMVESLKTQMGKAKAGEDEAQAQADQAEATVVRVQEHVASLNNLLEAMNTMAKKARNSTEKMETTVIQLTEQFHQVADGAQHQKQSLDETIRAMQEMNTVVLDVAQNASSAAESADNAMNKAQEGATVVNEAVDAISLVREVTNQLKDGMGALGKQAEAIGQVMNVVNDIADQTNLLALNAAIEAARAGEAGRGFAVVADEVRKLAEKTMNATKSVGENIHAIQESTRDNIGRVDKAAQAVEKATEQANLSGQTLAEIVDFAADNASQVQAIASAAEEQSAATEEISRSIETVHTIASETMEGMNRSSEVTNEIMKLAEEINTIIRDLKKNT